MAMSEVSLSQSRPKSNVVPMPATSIRAISVSIEMECVCFVYIGRVIQVTGIEPQINTKGCSIHWQRERWVLLGVSIALRREFHWASDRCSDANLGSSSSYVLLCLSSGGDIYVETGAILRQEL